MRNFLSLLAVLSMTGCITGENRNRASCAAEDTVAENQPVLLDQAAETMNMLTDQEKAEGWQLLFDGVTCSGWRGFKKDKFPETGWTVRDGLLMVEYSGMGEAGNGGDIITEEQFGDFELKIDWRISPGGNSGVMFRVTEDESYEDSWNTAPEVQILDDFGYEKLNDGYVITIKQMTGANYDMHAPSFYYANRPGEWNRFFIKVEGSHVEQWLNGHKIVDYELWSDEWMDLVKKSKFAGYADYGLAKKGHIALQDHGHAVWFRNIKLRRLLRTD